MAYITSHLHFSHLTNFDRHYISLSPTSILYYIMVYPVLCLEVTSGKRKYYRQIQPCRLNSARKPFHWSFLLNYIPENCCGYGEWWGSEWERHSNTQRQGTRKRLTANPHANVGSRRLHIHYMLGNFVCVSVKCAEWKSGRYFTIILKPMGLKGSCLRLRDYGDGKLSG